MIKWKLALGSDGFPELAVLTDEIFRVMYAGQTTITSPRALFSVISIQLMAIINEPTPSNVNVAETKEKHSRGTCFEHTDILHGNCRLSKLLTRYQASSIDSSNGGIRYLPLIQGVWHINIYMYPQRISQIVVIFRY
jgi:hypothetical protein